MKIAIMLLLAGVVAVAEESSQVRKSSHGTEEKSAVDVKRPDPVSPSQTESAPRIRVGRAAIEEALAQVRESRFENVPLRDAMNRLADEFQINVCLDEPALWGVGIRRDDPVSFKGMSASLEHILRTMFERAGLVWVTHDGVLLITTDRRACDEDLLETRVYRISNL